jgi:uncharacterized RDD family membrane protein YckC
MSFLHFLIFNQVTRFTLVNQFHFLDWNKRIKAAVVDVFYTLLVLFISAMIFIMPLLILAPLVMDGDTASAYLYAFAFATLKMVILNKDYFSSQSVVHRFLGLRVVDARTDAPASKVKCMLRNITVALWPVEAIFLIVNPERRLGDLIAGTKVVETPPTDPELILNDMRVTKLDADADMALLISACIVFVTSFFLR